MPGSLPLSRLPQAPQTVLLVGASGFVGGNVLRALCRIPHISIRTLTRSSQISGGLCQLESVSGNISDRSSVLRAAVGVDTIVNAASYVGHDSRQAERTNLEGVRNLTDACAIAGVSKLIHVSTTAVYGFGPFRGLKPGQCRFAPESIASQSRAAGDTAVLAAGGTVLRPSLIYGPGDIWLFPGLARMFSALGATIDGGSAALSTIAASTLGDLIATIATTDEDVAGPYHASDPTPTTLESLLGLVKGQGNEIDTASSVGLSEAIERLTLLGFTEHQVRMVGEDYWFDSKPIWDINRRAGR